MASRPARCSAGASPTIARSERGLWKLYLGDPDIDFVKLAEAFGGVGVNATSPGERKESVAKLLASAIKSIHDETSVSSLFI